jgi:hypothetical protein
MSRPDSPEEPDPPAQLAAVIPPGAVALAADPVSLVPALIAAAPSPPFSVQLAAVMANVPARAISPEQINARNAVVMREQNEFVSRFVANQLDFRYRGAAKARDEQEELSRRRAGGR